ncbi:MAG TPA: PEP/pyruvate-binding domain-containing protein [Thermomicrobiales bacterium]|nr:PEP/pyruvate-binding domain-containing protein [Thermomicrobiales bacterium]
MGVLPMQDDRLVWLDGACHGRDLVGGKGASLSRLFSLGAPVPPAITFTTHAYRDLAAHLALASRLAHLAAGAEVAVRQAIADTPLPGAVEHTVRRGWSVLRERIGPEPRIAVRSSAIDEDGGGYSFAGLHDTILGVTTEEAFVAAVRRCWGSLWTDRSITYRRSSGLVDDIAIAVIAQQLVPCDVSFVAFSADPVTGNQDHVVINAAWGLGEAIVSGIVTPDNITVGLSGAILAYTIGDKETMIVADESAAEGTRHVPVPRAMRRLPALADAQAATIATFTRKLAVEFGHPVDLEGGLVGDRLHLFQARPITTIGKPVA